MHKNNLGEFALKTIFGPIGYSILKETVNAYNTLKDINKELDKGFEKIDKQPTKKITNSSCVQGGYCDLKKQDSKRNTVNYYNNVEPTTKPVGIDWWLKGANDYVKNETSSKVELTEDDIIITTIEKECDLIILNYILKRFKENEKDLILKKLLLLFPYIYNEYEDIKIELESYNDFKFQDKVIERKDGTKEMKKSFKEAFTRRIYTLYGLLNNNPEDFTEREFKILEKILDDLDTNIKIYK